MEIQEFQEKSVRTLNTNLLPRESISNMCMGISGEAGEVIDHIKKNFYQGHELDKDHMKEELGDLMFYIVNLATMLDIEMVDVLQGNVDKLLKRYPNGFDENKSINRPRRKPATINQEFEDAIKDMVAKDEDNRFIQRFTRKE